VFGSDGRASQQRHRSRGGRSVVGVSTGGPSTGAVDVTQEAPLPRDAAWYSPVFVVAPPRSHSSVVSAMIGMHHQMFGFPELSLFRRELIGELLVDPPDWRHAPVSQLLAGVLRSLAELHEGTQDEASVARALDWLQRRRQWSGAHVSDHLFGHLVPRTPVEKSPENSSTWEYLRRLDVAYPRARYLHLTRHPLSTIRSMYRAWSGLGYWDIPGELMVQFCVGSWFFHHERLLEFLSGVSPDRTLRVRSEDVLNAPRAELSGICQWLGIDASEQAVATMMRPDLSPFARKGPVNASGGNDPEFLNDPRPRPTVIPPTLGFPSDWLVDPWMQMSCMELAHRLGYHERAD
jgi:hypothetical protein